MNNWVDFLPLILLVFIFWFLVIRPARTRQREFSKTQQELKPGTEVMLASGIYGDVVAVDTDTLDLQIAPDTVITVARQAVGRIIPAGTFEDPDADTDADTETSPEH